MAPPDSPTPAQTLRRSTAALLAFWLLLAGALWWGFAWWEGRQRAGLEPYQMAGGTREGRLVHGVPVKAGPLAHNDVSVTTGLDMGDGSGALLGQSFLRHFDVRIESDRMVLHPR